MIMKLFTTNISVLPCVDTMTQLNLFKASLSSPQVTLPSPDGPLSHEVPSTAISAANKEVEEVMTRDFSGYIA